MLVLSKFHRSPVVVLLLEGLPMGINPQWGPSINWSTRISWLCVFGSRKIKDSSDRRMILMFEKRYNTLMFPISWSNLPPSAPRTRMHRLALSGPGGFLVMNDMHLCKSVVSWSCDSSTILVPCNWSKKSVYHLVVSEQSFLSQSAQELLMSRPPHLNLISDESSSYRINYFFINLAVALTFDHSLKR